VSDRAHRDWLVNAHHTASQDFDKAVMTLAAGALAISITFIHEIAPHPTHHRWLATSWLFLAISLLLVFVSYLASQRVLEHEIGNCDDAIARAIAEERGETSPPTQPSKRDIAGPLTTCLNYGAAGTFVIGVVLLVRFALYNL
jgi:hypothetical protein